MQISISSACNVSFMVVPQSAGHEGLLVNAGQHHPCNGNNRLFLATAFCEMLISNHKIKLFSAFYSGKDTLDELWLEILPCLGVPGKFFLAGTLIICRVQGQAQPRNTDSCQIQ